jgi:dihydroorotate dehydrogenase
MVDIYQALRPLLFQFDAETAHHLGLWALELLDLTPSVARRLRERALKPSGPPVAVAGIKFPSVVGLAAGLDKNAEALVGLFALGFGFIEVGTVTPRAQPGNDRPRLFRLPPERAIINRFGFNNLGDAAMLARLRELEWRPCPVGVNIGKNKDTANEDAVHDYVRCASLLSPVADYIVVNLSSPNTPGLRSLQAAEPLRQLLNAVRLASTAPVFVKLAPDLTDTALREAVDVAVDSKVAGFVCTNTTLERNVAGRHSHESGGLSGLPLQKRSTEVIRQVFRHCGGALPIIGVGGIFTADDAWEKICAGASLVQVYTGLVYQGPLLPRQLNQGLAHKLAQAGLRSMTQAVGRNA